MSRTKTKRYLVLLAAVGLVAAALGGSGTFASFNAEVSNTGNTFASGTLVLNDNGGTTTCTSAGDAANQNNLSTNGCDTLFTVPAVTSVTGALTTALTTAVNGTTSLAFTGGLTGGSIDAGDSIIVTSGSNTQTFTATAGADTTSTSVTVTAATAGFAYPIGSTITDVSNTHYAKLTLTNAGTLDASDISFKTPAACASAAAEGSSTLTGGPLSGSPTTISFASIAVGAFKSGDPVVVSSGGHTQTFIATAPSTATSVTVVAQAVNFAYPTGSTVSGPSFTPAGNLCSSLKLSIVETDSAFDHTLALPATGCAYGSGPGSAGLGCTLNSGTTLSSVPTSLTPLTLASGANSNSGTNLSAAKSRYFLIAVKQSGGFADNTFQNRKASFDLTWHIDQS
jgi:hypothetical protein